jgi:hypothetical protein
MTAHPQPPTRHPAVDCCANDCCTCSAAVLLCKRRLPLTGWHHGRSHHVHVLFVLFVLFVVCTPAPPQPMITRGRASDMYRVRHVCLDRLPTGPHETHTHVYSTCSMYSSAAACQDTQPTATTTACRHCTPGLHAAGWAWDPGPLHTSSHNAVAVISGNTVNNTGRHKDHILNPVQGPHASRLHTTWTVHTAASCWRTPPHPTSRHWCHALLACLPIHHVWPCTCCGAGWRCHLSLSTVGITRGITVLHSSSQPASTAALTFLVQGVCRGACRLMLLCCCRQQGRLLRACRSHSSAHGHAGTACTTTQDH